MPVDMDKDFAELFIAAQFDFEERNDETAHGELVAAIKGISLELHEEFKELGLQHPYACSKTLNELKDLYRK